MSAFSNYLEDAITAWINGTTFPAAPANVYLALYNNSPSDAGNSGTELTTTLTGSANRIGIAANQWTRVTGGTASITNTNAITITASAAGNATATHFGVFDAQTAGNLLFHGALTASKTITTGDEVKFNAASLTLNID